MKIWLIQEYLSKNVLLKKQKILTAGFALFTEKGYYKTKTIEIAKRAGVSTGAVYSYFKHKKEIYISAFKNYLDNLSDRLFRELEKISPSDLASFVDGWIAAYLELYASSGRTLAQLRMMTIDDKEIKHHFSASESTYFSKVIEILGKNGIIHDNIYEKIYACCVLVDTLRQENSVFSHNELNLTVFKQKIKSAIMALLSN